MGRIMVATNAGAGARVLHVAAIRHASSSGSALSVVHVVSGDDYEAQPAGLRDAIRSELEWLLHTLFSLAQQQSGADSIDVSVHVRDGDVSDELVEFATSTRPDLVMLGMPD